MITLRTSRTAALGAGLLLASLLGACGGGSSHTSTATTPTTAGNTSAGANGSGGNRRRERDRRRQLPGCVGVGRRHHRIVDGSPKPADRSGHRQLDLRHHLHQNRDPVGGQRGRRGLRHGHRVHLHRDARGQHGHGQQAHLLGQLHRRPLRRRRPGRRWRLPGRDPAEWGQPAQHLAGARDRPPAAPADSDSPAARSPPSAPPAW